MVRFKADLLIAKFRMNVEMFVYHTRCTILNKLNHYLSRLINFIFVIARILQEFVLDLLSDLECNISPSVSKKSLPLRRGNQALP